MRALVAWLVYPALVGGTLAVTLVAIDRSIDANVILVATTVAAALLTAALERLLPFEREWLRSRGDLGPDGIYFVTTTIASEGGRIAIVALAAAAATALGRASLPALWPTKWPLLAQLALALPLAELPGYVVHRWQHEAGGLLWRLHATHHSVPRMYWLNAFRQHPLDAWLSAFLYLAPLVVFGAEPALFTLFSVFSVAHSFLQHSNVDVRLGPLNYVFSMAEVHRWHHARPIAQSNANYGQMVLVWDVIFGTRKVPEGISPPADVGLATTSFPTTLLAQLASPFVARWWRAGPQESPEARGA
jgi:sterol desaturase/sphingolipid hydroxylase (fatty acid hydroxylase superfamily)